MSKFADTRGRSGAHACGGVSPVTLRPLGELSGACDEAQTQAKQHPRMACFVALVLGTRPLSPGRAARAFHLPGEWGGRRRS